MELARSAQSAERTTNQAANPPSPTLSQATQIENDSTKPRQATLRTEVQQLLVEVSDLRRDVQRLVQMLEARLPTARERGEVAEEHSDASQRPPGDVQLPERVDSDDFRDPLMTPDSKPVTRNLTLQEAVLIGVQNCPGLVLEPQRSSNGGITVRPAVAGGDAASTEARITVLISDIETAYIDLWSAYGEVRTAKQFCEKSVDLWRQVAGNSDKAASTQEQESAARETYFRFRDQQERSQQVLHSREQRLRTLLGLAASDGRMIAPTGLPDLVTPNVNWDKFRNETLRDLPAIRKQKAIVLQQELQLKNYETNGAEPSENGQRRRRIELRNYQLGVARERARLEDLELNAMHQLTEAIRQCDTAWSVAETDRNRSAAAEGETRALSELERVGRLDGIDLILDAQQRWAHVCTDYQNARARLAKAIMNIQGQVGSLLEYHHITVAENQESGAGPVQPSGNSPGVGVNNDATTMGTPLVDSDTSTIEGTAQLNLFAPIESGNSSNDNPSSSDDDSIPQSSVGP